ncbi:hypothetical protein HBH75_025950 [Parastagonospora nodorum]|nr:hypothetical protein HBH75_025950 [Parastagonospora nodorum]
MAELAGSIVGIVSAGTKVALVLSQLASDIGSAGQEARMISSEIRTFCTILNTLKDTMGKISDSSYYAHCSDMVRDMTTASVEMFTEVLNAAESLRSMTNGKDGRDGKFKFVSRVNWVVFQKPKIVVLRAAIEAYKSNIALMLGTINTVEKVARRTSIPQHFSNVAEDDQERTTLQSLELDHRASLISLEQAERQYEKLTLQHSAEDAESPAEYAWLDTIIDTNVVVRDDSISGDASQHATILQIARMEVNSIRDSLTRSSWGEDSLQDQVVRHSQRLSKLMEEDHRRLSQRWSALLLSNHDNSDTSLHGEGFLGQVVETSDEPVLPGAHVTFTMPGQEATYIQFRKWLLWQPWSLQDQILEALRSEVFSDRLWKDQASALDAVLAQSGGTPNGFDDATPPELETGSPPGMKFNAISEEGKVEHVARVDDQQDDVAESKLDFDAITLTKAHIVDIPSETVQTWVWKRTQKLDLSWNFIRTVPQSMGLCTNLRRLDLGYNHLETIPQPLLLLNSLVALDLRGNMLRAIPSAISRLTALQSLLLSDNRIQGLPLAIGGMKTLQILELSRNPVVFPSANSFFDMRRSLPRDTSPDQRQFDTIGTARLKSYLKCYPADDMTGTYAQAVAGNLPEDALRFQLETQAISMARYKTIGDARNSNENAMYSDEFISFTRQDNPHRGLLKPEDVDHTLGIDALLSPRITLHTVEGASASYSSKRHDMHDHRRSRSHEVSSNRGTMLSPKLADNRSLDVAGRSNKAAEDDANTSWETFSKTIPEVMLQKRDTDWRSGPMTAPMDGIPTPVSPPSKLTTRPESYSGQTPRKEKRYSMMFA